MNYQRMNSARLILPAGIHFAAANTSKYTTAKKANATNGRSSIDQAKFMRAL